jgi:hypothetical protein
MKASTMLVALVLAMPCANATTPAAALTPVFHAGDRYADVFSRTIDLHADGFSDNVRRVSGTADYRVLAGSSARPRLHIDYTYDGLHQGSGTVELADGGATSCFEGRCSPATDASGLSWNPRLWGPAPASLRVGQHWEVVIAAPWELGPAGRQTVTVIAYDPRDRRVTLEREGGGEGAPAGEPFATTLVRDGHSYPVRVLPGRSHWVGYTSFRAGIVVSDELLVERPVTLVSGALGRIAAREREYILLNAMPSPAPPG